jgi:predicted P-loop ATPase
MFLRKYQIKKNEITRKYEWRGKEMNTEDLNTVYLEAKAQFEKLSNDMFISILFSHFTPMYNPVKDYFEGLKWDCVDRIEPLVKCITSDTGTDIFRFSAVRSWLLGIIESVYTDEPNILQLIFAGKQNTGKSVFFKQLLPEPLKKYMALSQLDAGKDDQILMCEKLIILDDEYSGKSKDDAKLIKRLLSAPYFNLREPYGKQNVTIKRIASLCATTNETQILNDVTGNRRNLVLEITGKFDFDLYNSIDKEQLFAQLVELHKLGFTSQLNDVMIEQIKEFTQGRNSAPNREEEAIDKLFHPPGMHDGYSYYTNTEILAYINDKMKLFINQKMLGMVLSEMGYEKKQKGKTRIQVYKIMKKE